MEQAVVGPKSTHNKLLPDLTNSNLTYKKESEGERESRRERKVSTEGNETVMQP